MNHKGTGLGLSICKSLVEQMGGKVRVESEINVGSKFIITMQLKAIDTLVYRHDNNLRETQKREILE